MSADAERRFLAPEPPAEGAVAQPMPCWPMTFEQWAFAQSVVTLGAWRAFAWWLRARCEDGRDRFSARDLPMLDCAGANPHALVDVGLLRIHRYPSGAWQYAANPYTRSWYQAVILTPVPVEHAVTP